ncbi:Hypothetical predicted protein, partial [Paramuricea clavata]
RKRIKKDKGEEFLRDWLKVVGAVGEQESESEENEEEMEADLSRKLPQNRSRNPTIVTSAQWELSDSSEDSGREDPFLGGMSSSDSELL